MKLLSMLHFANVRNARGRRLADKDKEEEDGKGLGSSGHDTSGKTKQNVKNSNRQY
jgi:hypothetical protein